MEIMEILGTIWSWITIGLLWILRYLIGGGVFGAINHALQRRICTKNYSCNWESSECNHCMIAAAGYILYPIVLPATVIYAAVRYASLNWITDWMFAIATERRQHKKEMLELRAAVARLQGQLPGSYDHAGHPIDRV